MLSDLLFLFFIFMIGSISAMIMRPYMDTMLESYAVIVGMFLMILVLLAWMYAAGIAIALRLV